MHKLMIISASTRPGRKGPALARWITGFVKANHGDLEIDFVDLGELKLPMMDEAEHPQFKKYQHQHTKDWSARVEAADGFIFVMPEYNYGFIAPIKNAIDFLSQEWGLKPVGFVTYGGIAAGTRALQLLKPVLGALKMVAINEAVNVAFFAKQIEGETFKADEGNEAAAKGMMAELLKWIGPLKGMRGKA